MSERTPEAERDLELAEVGLEDFSEHLAQIDREGGLCPYIADHEVPCELWALGHCKPQTCLTLAAHTEAETSQKAGQGFVLWCPPFHTEAETQ